MAHRKSVRVAGIAVAAVIPMALAACSSGSSSSSSSSTTGSSSAPSSAAAAGKSYNVELVVGTKSDDFYVTMECGAMAEAKALGVNLTVTGPADFSAPEQAPILNAVAASKPDALIVAPLADAIILVAAASQTRKDDVTYAKRMIRSVKAKLCGCVLTKARIRSGGYYYYPAAVAADAAD